MGKIYYIDTLKRTIKTLSFFNTDDILLNHKINIVQFEEVGKIGGDSILRVKKHNHCGFLFKRNMKKFYGDYLVANKNGLEITSSTLSTMELYYNIDFFAQPALALARAIKKEGYCLSGKVNFAISGREMTLFLPMLLKGLKFYPVYLQSGILELVQKYNNDMLNIDELFGEIFLSISYYYMQEQDKWNNSAGTKPYLKVSGL